MNEEDIKLLEEAGYSREVINAYFSTETVEFNVDLEEARKYRHSTCFPLVDGVMDERLHRVYPIMQRDVQRIMEAVNELPIKVILFGSSLTGLCNVTSDIDICVGTEGLDRPLFIKLQIKLERAASTLVIFCI